MSLAVMYLDRDGFKEVNDGYGHSTGDALLKLVGERLLSVVRGYDAVARLGGDEFALLIEDIGEDIDPVEFAERVISALAEPMVVDQVCHNVTASIGVAMYPESGDGALLGTLTRLFVQTVQAFYAARAAASGVSGAKTGAVTVAQRTSSDLRLAPKTCERRPRVDSFPARRNHRSHSPGAQALHAAPGRAGLFHSTYAKSAHGGPVQNIDHTVSYVYSTWLSQSGRRHTYGADLEMYGHEYHPSSADSVIYYAIPTT